MKLSEPEIFAIGSFEGPLDLLWHLIHSQEIDIYQIPIHTIMQQHMANLDHSHVDLDQGAEFVGLSAALVLLKSKTLLPKHEQTNDTLLDEEKDPRFDIIHHVLDYCRFKQAGKDLAQREQQQTAFYPRGIEESEGETRKKLGIHHLSIDDLAALFKTVLAKATPQKGLIHEETWKVSDKIQALRHIFKNSSRIPFVNVFVAGLSRQELIVTFLALLELMKMGEACVALDAAENTIYIQASE